VIATSYDTGRTKTEVTRGGGGKPPSGKPPYGFAPDEFRGKLVYVDPNKIEVVPEAGGREPGKGAHEAVPPAERPDQGGDQHDRIVRPRSRERGEGDRDRAVTRPGRRRPAPRAAQAVVLVHDPGQREPARVRRRSREPPGRPSRSRCPGSPERRRRLTRILRSQAGGSTTSRARGRQRREDGAARSSSIGRTPPARNPARAAHGHAWKYGSSAGAAIGHDHARRRRWFGDASSVLRS
jgi:hypothetical protein